MSGGSAKRLYPGKQGNQIAKFPQWSVLPLVVSRDSDWPNGVVDSGEVAEFGEVAENRQPQLSLLICIFSGKAM
ncbi:hypothetical protein RRSWK_04678 [Rhodopirellula sp. SWK7]|nr:hypothetical protein RRSWK_04678 [Rhodopirellula sp. SWK7]